MSTLRASSARSLAWMTHERRRERAETEARVFTAVRRETEREGPSRAIGSAVGADPS